MNRCFINNKMATKKVITPLIHLHKIYGFNNKNKFFKMLHEMRGKMTYSGQKCILTFDLLLVTGSRLNVALCCKKVYIL